MKKTIGLLLAAVICLSIAACSGGAPANTTSRPQIPYNISAEMSADEKFDAISHECDAFIEIKINPEFELYIAWDEDIDEMRVLGVRPINEDAETLFQSLSVSNMTLYDALYSIFNTAKESGYLNSESSIEIAYYGQVEGYNVTEVIPIILEGYQQENNVSFAYNTSFTEIGGSAVMLNPDDYDEVEYDADGNLVKTVCHIDEHSIETCTYDSDGNITLRVTEYQNDEITVEEYLDRGMVVKMVMHIPGETRTEIYDADGKKVSVITDNTENRCYREEYYTDGILSESYYRDAERECTETFDANGNKTSQIVVNQFESYWTYDSHGNMTSEIVDHQEEGWYSEQYWTDGVLVKSYSRRPEYEMTQTFDIDGHMLSQIIDNKEEGSFSETYWTYYADGAVESYQLDFSGAEYGYYEEKQYYQNGAVSMDYKVYLYGSISGDNKFYYDESGNPTRYEGKNSFGERVEITYHTDGSHVDRIYESNGAVRTETWDADGRLTVTYE